MRRLQRFEAELITVGRERASLTDAESDELAYQDAAATLEELAYQFEEAEAVALEAENAHASARDAEARSRGPLAEAEKSAQRLETEARTLNNLLGSASGGQWPPVVDQISVARGYEAALGAALGDDLEASVKEGAPARWAGAGVLPDDPVLPEGAESLGALVDAPPALARRLAQIGVVARERGALLVANLKPGQRLVSKEGDLWRWDGFVAAAEAPTPAARRLAEKNRLGDLMREAEAARQAAEAAKWKRAARRRRCAKPLPANSRRASGCAPPAPPMTQRAKNWLRPSAAAPDPEPPFRARRSAGASQLRARRSV